MTRDLKLRKILRYRDRIYGYVDLNLEARFRQSHQWKTACGGISQGPQLDAKADYADRMVLPGADSGPRTYGAANVLHSGQRKGERNLCQGALAVPCGPDTITSCGLMKHSASLRKFTEILNLWPGQTQTEPYPKSPACSRNCSKTQAGQAAMLLYKTFAFVKKENSTTNILPKNKRRAKPVSRSALTTTEVIQCLKWKTQAELRQETRRSTLAYEQHFGNFQ